MAAIDTKDCIVRELSVPFLRDDQIQKTLPFEAENSLVTFDVEEMILEYLKIGEAEGRSSLLLFAARDNVVGDRLEVLKEGGVDPVSLDLDAAALFNAFALTPTFDPERNTLLVDIGATSTKVLLIEDGTLKKIRSIRLGAFLGSFNPRQIAEPAMTSQDSAAVGRLTDYEIPDASSIENRFEEIEGALRRLDPLGAEPLMESSSGGGATAPWANDEAGDEIPGSDDDEPIAILSDDDYERVAADPEAFDDGLSELLSDGTAAGGGGGGRSR